MLKRSVIIVLAILYVVTVSGFVLNFHYCCNRLYSFKIDAPAKTCIKGEETRAMDCCKNKHIEIKVKDTHQAGSPSFWGKFFIFDLPALSAANFSFSLQEPSTQIFLYRGPPPEPPGTPLFIKNCIFRI